MKFDPSVEIQADGGARVVLAKDQLKAGEERSAAIEVELPKTCNGMPA
jgi:hypothetical protein